MAKKTPSHLSILERGIDHWNRWRQDKPDIIPMLDGAELRDANLKEANLSNANIRWANLAGANLHGANLFQTELFQSCLRSCDLSYTDMRGAKLHDANLINAVLNGANLFRCDFINTQLNRASFNGSFCGTTAFSNLDLSQVSGLDKIKHMAPSNIDLLTISRSKGTLPYQFLSDAGVPDSLLKIIREVTPEVETPDYYSCFISYSTKDHKLAEKLFSDLQSSGIRAWYAPHELKAGQKIIDQIDTGIKDTDKLLLILSENSIGSEWVKTEITKAQKKLQQIGKQVLFPISITKYEKLKEWEFYLEGKNMAQEIRDFYLLNFENWKDHDEYKRNFDELVESLRIETDTNI